MERKVGETFLYGNVLLTTIEYNPNDPLDACDGCFLLDYSGGYCLANKYIGRCSAIERTDNKQVIFKVVGYGRKNY